MERFTFVRKIGEGTFGQVGLYTDNVLSRDVAIKMMSDEPSYRREVYLTKALQHNKHIVRLIDSFQVKDHFFMVMNRGDTNLSNYIHRFPRGLRPQTALSITLQIAYAIQSLHATDWVHTDIKPENVILTFQDDGILAQLIDFGSSEYEPQFMSERVTDITTLWYRSPEVLLGFEGNLSKPIDIWSLGNIFVQMMTGIPPFPGGSSAETLAMIEFMLGPFDPLFLESAESLKFFEPNVYEESEEDEDECRIYETNWIRRCADSLEDVYIPGSFVTHVRTSGSCFYSKSPCDFRSKSVNLIRWLIPPDEMERYSQSSFDRIVLLTHAMLCINPGMRANIHRIIDLIIK